MGMRGGNVGHVDGKVFSAFGTTMDGIMKFDVDRTPGVDVSEVMKGAYSGTSSRRGGVTIRATCGLFIATANFFVGFGQVFDMFDTFRRVGDIFTGTGHGKFLLE